MNARKKWPRAIALQVAEELQAMLAPACSRIAIVGSLRRGKMEVGDVELLYISRTREIPDGLFDTRIVNVADAVCDGLLQCGVLAKRPNVKGHFTWGVSNKLAVHVASGVPVDLFQTGTSNWWVSLVIRTGSKETNLRLTNGAINRGGSLNAYGYGVTWKDGTVTAALSEKSVFDICGVPYLEPSER
jgi:DNA polymerase/3'-5' exonuclease PolX